MKKILKRNKTMKKAKSKKTKKETIVIWVKDGMVQDVDIPENLIGKVDYEIKDLDISPDLGD